ncbi:MAG TPA: hypothetical protein VF692_01735 [Pyrinomonadaceae bacterium]
MNFYAVWFEFKARQAKQSFGNQSNFVGIYKLKTSGVRKTQISRPKNQETNFRDKITFRRRIKLPPKASKTNGL